MSKIAGVLIPNHPWCYSMWNRRVSVLFVISLLIFLDYLNAKNNLTLIKSDSFALYVDKQLNIAKEFRYYDLKKSLSITENLLKDSLKYPNDSLLYDVKYYHSYYLMMNDNNNENKVLIEEISPYFKQNNLKKWAVLRLRTASTLINFGEYDKAIDALNDALPITQELKMNISEGLVYIFRCKINELKSDFVSAYKNADLALQIFKEIDRKDWISDVLTTFGHICTQIEDFECASQYFDQVFEYKDEIENTRFIVRPLFYSGIMHFEAGNFNQAKVNFEKGLEKIHLFGNFPDYSLIYECLGKISMQEQDYLKARDHINTAISYAKKSNNKRFRLSNQLVLVEIESVLQPEKYNLPLIEEVYDWARNNEDYQLLKESSKILSSYYIKKGNYKEALEFKEVYTKASESKMARDKLNEIGLIKAKNKLEKEAKERELSKKELEFKLRSNKKITRLMRIGICLLLLMSVFLFYYYREKNTAYNSLQISNNELKKTENILELKNHELKKYIDSNIQLEQFAHVASHDLRAPLITINSFSKLLRAKISDKLTDQESKYLGFIQTNGNQMLELVNDLLEYSKINSQKVNPALVDTQTLVENVITVTNNQALEKEVELKITNQLPQIFADEIKIKRVFQNLISNAIKFSDPKKRAEINIYFDDHPNYWNFHVADNGIGIKDNSVNIFQPYTQLNRKSEYKGTGLGLSICEKIIHQHGGEISYSSEFGEGTTFTFSINKELN